MGFSGGLPLGTFEFDFQNRPEYFPRWFFLLHGYVDRSSRFYEGAVLSVRAQKLNGKKFPQGVSSDPFQNLMRLDSCYDETREIEPHPFPEDPAQRLLDRLRQEQPCWRAEDGGLKPMTSPSGRKSFLEAPLAAAKLKMQTFSPPAPGWNEHSVLKFRELVKGKIEEMGFQVLRDRDVAAGGFFRFGAPASLNQGNLLDLGQASLCGFQDPAEILKETAHMMEAVFCFAQLIIRRQRKRFAIRSPCPWLFWRNR